MLAWIVSQSAHLELAAGLQGTYTALPVPDYCDPLLLDNISYSLLSKSPPMYIYINIIDVNSYDAERCGKDAEKCKTRLGFMSGGCW